MTTINQSINNDMPKYFTNSSDCKYLQIKMHFYYFML